MAIQLALDKFLQSANLRSVADLIFVPQESKVVVRRNQIGRKGAVIDVASACSVSEVIDIVSHSPAVY